MSLTRVTKQGSINAAFTQAASRDPEGALSFMILAAFGVTLAAVQTVAATIVKNNDMKIFLLCTAAAVQIRAHVVFVGREFGDIRTKYPTLVIEGTRPQSDIFNFGALHAVGHFLAHMTNAALAAAILKKAGSCITGANVTENEAGKINKEISEGWTPEDKAAASTFLANVIANDANKIATWYAAVPQKSREFNLLLTSAVAPPVAGRPSTGGPPPPATLS